MDTKMLEGFLVELYQKSREGQAAVEAFCELFLTSTEDAWGKEHPYASLAWERSKCRECETVTPTVPYVGGDEDEDLEPCAVCSQDKLWPEERQARDYAENQIRLRESWYE